MATVGVVGVGRLGRAVAGRLLAAGHRVIAYDIVPDNLARLAALGGSAAASAGAVASASEIVLTLLPSLASVEEAILGPGGVVAGARSGQAIAQMSTISPALADRLAQEVGGRGLAYLDCPVSGTSAMVERGEGIVLAGGDRAVFERWRPLLESIVPRAVYIGRPGQAAVAKLVANLLVALHSAAAAEALVMARRASLDLGVVLDILTSGAAGSRMLELRGPMMVRREFPPQMSLDLFMKDLALILDAGSRLGAPLPLTTVAQRLYAAARDAGHGEEDLAVVATALEALAGPPANAPVVA